MIEKQTAGWTRRREYSIGDCRDLEWKEGGEDQPHRLQCKVGWRTVKFGKSISEEEGIEIITALQTSLPEVAHQMLSSSGEMKKHFTTLDLS